jgi:hypothetical protein
MPTIAELAQQMNVDITALPQEFVGKLDGFYSEGERLRTDATHNYELAKREREQTNEYISNYAGNTTRVATLEAENAGLRTTLTTLKDKGIEVTIPAAPTGAPKEPASFDPKRFRGEMGYMLGQAIDASNTYLRLYGKPLPESIESLAEEANARRLKPFEWAAQKYKFADKEGEISAADKKAHDDKVAADAVEKYKTEHPVTTGNPDMQRGRSSRSPALPKPMSGNDIATFANLPAREKVAQSIARSKQIATERAAANA